MNDHSRFGRRRSPRGESVVLAIRTTRTITAAMDEKRGALTRSRFAAKAIEQVLRAGPVDDDRADAVSDTPNPPSPETKPLTQP